MEKNITIKERVKEFQKNSLEKYFKDIEQYNISNYKKGEYIELPIFISSNAQNIPNNLNTFLNLINQIKSQNTETKKGIYETLYNPLGLLEDLPTIISEMIHKIQTGELVLNFKDEKIIPDLIQEYVEQSIQSIENKQKNNETTDISIKTALDIKYDISDRLLPVLIYEANLQKENKLKEFSNSIKDISNEEIKEIIFKKSIIKSLRESSIEHNQKAKNLKSLNP